MRRTISVLERAIRAGGPRRRLLTEAIASLAAASLALRVLPFRNAIRLGAVSLRGEGLPAERVDELAEAVRRSADVVPWRAVCIERGIALQRMLRRRGVDAKLHYGIANHPADRLSAHVWVSVDGQTVIGGEEARHYAEVAAFPA